MVAENRTLSIDESRSFEVGIADDALVLVSQDPHNITIVGMNSVQAFRLAAIIVATAMELYDQEEAGGDA